jgi:hypothetical protein
MLPESEPLSAAVVTGGASYGARYGHGEAIRIAESVTVLFAMGQLPAVKALSCLC